MSEPKNEGDPGQKQDFGEYAATRTPAGEKHSRGGAFLRGCAIAIGIAILVLAFVVGACFLAI